MTKTYSGLPWRSRFLRAPKIAFALAERYDFIALSEIADVRLGLKTGADAFFYLTPDGPAKGSGTRVVRVTGLKGAWTGLMSAKDLVPAALNPHRFITSAGRTFLLPREPDAYYLSPRKTSQDEGLLQYVRAGERMGINRTALVQANAGDRWFRQVRGIIRSRWALPYNSAYDYGPFDNTYRAVLNGRFVGVDPLENVHPEFLGLALATTFVAASRLLEGTATGVEGAFDVGPPAARRMVVPDVRRFSGSSHIELEEIADELRATNVMPAAPSRHADVPPLRHRLDLAVLRALGLTPGEASSLTGKVYEGYARWRSAVELIEARMRANRREMSRSGASRAISPTELAARRIWEELDPDFPAYPRDFLSAADELEEADVPRSFRVSPQSPLMGAGLIAERGVVVDLRFYERTRYADMLLRLAFEPPLQIPNDPVKAGAIVDGFQEHLRRLRAAALAKSAAYIKKPADRDVIVAAVEREWLRKCRRKGMIVSRADA